VGELELVVNGQAYGGWTSATITRSIEQLADTFALGFTERWTPDAKPLPIREGSPCSVSYDRKPVIVGYVDESNTDYDKEQHTASVDGRAKTGDLVDCSAKFHSWKNQTLTHIATTLCQPFGVRVSVAAGVDVSAQFRRFAVQDGETGYEAIERAARMRGVLLTTDGRGDLVITRAGAKRTATVLRQGDNIIRGSRNGSMKDRYKDYTLKAQVSSDDDFNGQLALCIKATASDSGVKRHRPLTVMADAQETKTQLTKRAEWERNVRLGRGLRLSYTVQGWEHASGLWEPNLLVQVKDDFLGIDGQFLVMTARLVLDENGTTADLELAPPEAVSVEPPKPVKRGPGFLL
jgi:prophage tail gpP-like protein